MRKRNSKPAAVAVLASFRKASRAKHVGSRSAWEANFQIAVQDQFQAHRCFLGFVVASASISKGCLNSADNLPFFQVQFESTKLRSRRFSLDGCFRNSSGARAPSPSNW